MPARPKGISIAIGIDPGKSGGLAAIKMGNVLWSITYTKIPSTERDILDWLQQFDSRLCKAVIETITTGHPKSSKSDVAKLYGSYMSLRMALVANGISFEAINTAKWARGLGIPPKKKTENRTQWKNRLKAKAQELFPQCKVTLATADALLIAEYCRRTLILQGV